MDYLTSFVTIITLFIVDSVKAVYRCPIMGGFGYSYPGT